jgi:hypothetical protein
MKAMKRVHEAVVAGLICILGAGAGRADLKGYWKLNETSGSAVNDEMSTTDGSVGSSTSWVEGLFGNAIRLPGVTGNEGRLHFIRTSDGLNISGASDRTYSFWAHIPTGSHILFLLPSGTGFRFWRRNNNRNYSGSLGKSAIPG